MILLLGCTSEPTSYAMSKRPKPSLANIPDVAKNYIVVFKNKSSRENAVIKHNLRVRHRFNNVFKGFSSNMSPQAYIALSNNPNVTIIEEDRGNVKPVEQILPFGIDRVEADQSIIAKIDGNDERVDVDIAILDTGIDDLPDLNVVFSIDFTGQSIEDGVGHGSHVAGIAAAIDNDIDIVGVAPGARLYNIKVLGIGSGDWANIIAGMDWVVANADIIDVANMSLGGEGYLESVHIAAKAMTNAGVIVVVAAGNESDDIYGADREAYTNDDHCPACFSEVMTVSAMFEQDGMPGGLASNSDDKFAAFFSDFSESVIEGHPVESPGLAIDIAMPGVNVLSFWHGDLVRKTGTSMASPMAAGVIALLVAEFGKPIDSTGVYNLRQYVIDNAFPQEGWRTDGIISDPDSNHEGMGNANTDTDGSGNMWPVVKILSPIKNKSYLFGEDILFSVSALDPEDGDLSDNIIWSSDLDGPIGIGTGFTLSGGSGINSGIHQITAWTTDQQGFEGSRTIAIIVVDTINNFEPVLDSIGSKSVDEGQELAFFVRAIDNDATVPILTTSLLPRRALFKDNLDSTGYFSWRPDFEQGGIYSITFYANDFDGDFIDSETIIINVNDLPPPEEYIFSQRIPDLSGGVHFDITLSEVDEFVDSIVIYNQGDTISTSYLYTETRVPGNNHWPDLPMTVQFHSIGGAGMTWINFSVSRIDENGIVQETSDTSSSVPVFFNIMNFSTIPAHTWDFGSITDRLQLNYNLKNFLDNGQGLRFGTGSGGTDARGIPVSNKLITQIPRNTTSPEPYCCVLAGDANNNGKINIVDATYIISWMFSGGPSPICMKQADANASGSVNMADVTYLIAYIFTGGPAPICLN